MSLLRDLALSAVTATAGLAALLMVGSPASARTTVGDEIRFDGHSTVSYDILHEDTTNPTWSDKRDATHSVPDAADWSRNFSPDGYGTYGGHQDWWTPDGSYSFEGPTEDTVDPIPCVSVYCADPNEPGYGEDTPEDGEPGATDS